MKLPFCDPETQKNFSVSSHTSCSQESANVQKVAYSSQGEKYPARKPYYSALDGLRGIAAIAVMIFHFSEVLFLYSTMRNPLIHCWLAVDFFFCLSGFVIAHAYDQRMKTIGLGRFFLNRLIRLHPLVIIGSIIGVIAYAADPFLYTPLVAGLKKVLFTFFLSLLMIPTPYLQYRSSALFPYNGPTWSLFFEYIINVIYAFALSSVARRWLVFIGALSAAFLIYVVQGSGQFHGGWSAENYMHGFARVGYSFIVGLLIFRYHLTFRHRLGFLLPCFILIVVLLSPHYPSDWKMELFFVMLILPIVVCVGAGANTSGLTERLCKFLGRISYPLYMTHMPTVLLFRNYFHKINPTNDELIVVAVFLIVFSLLFAYVIMRWIDEPVRKWLNSVSKKTLQFLKKVSKMGY